MLDAEATDVLREGSWLADNVEDEDMQTSRGSVSRQRAVCRP